LRLDDHFLRDFRCHVLILLTALLSCGESQTTFGEICNGQPGLRLLVKYQFARDRVTGGMSVLQDLSGLLAIDGTCRYWAEDATETDVWNTVRTGVLDRATAEDVARRVRYGRWPDGGFHWVAPTCFDCTTRNVSDGRNVVRCTGLCEEAPNGLGLIFAEADLIRRELWDAGVPAAGPLMVRADDYREQPLALSQESVAWPAKTVDLESIAVKAGSPAFATTLGTRVDDAQDTKALRMVRDAYQKRGKRVWFWGWIPIRRDAPVAGSPEFVVFVRDWVPFEGPAGEIPLTW
jgi:hypothetical protein